MSPTTNPTEGLSVESWVTIISSILIAIASIAPFFEWPRKNIFVPIGRWAWNLLSLILQPGQVQQMGTMSRKINEMSEYVLPNGGKTLLAGGKSIPDTIKAIELRQALHQAMFKAYIDDDQVPGFWADADGLIDEVTRTIGEMLDLDERRLLGRGWIGVIMEEERDRTEREWNRAIKAGIDINVTTLLAKSGRQVRISASPIKYGPKVYRYQGSIRLVSGLPRVAAENIAGRPRILLVEDDSVTRSALEVHFKIGQLELKTAGSLAASMSILDEGFAPTLALVDLMLPDGSGLAVVDRIIEEHPNAKVVVMTGGGADYVNAARQRGVDVIVKPFSWESLVSTTGIIL